MSSLASHIRPAGEILTNRCNAKPSPPLPQPFPWVWITPCAANLKPPLIEEAQAGLTQSTPLAVSAAVWDVPAAPPCSMCHHFSLPSPGGPRKRMGILGKQNSPHWAPQGLSLRSANVCVLRFVICLPPQAGFPCFSKLFSGRCWDVFPTWSKALPLPTHATKPGNSQNTQPNPSQRSGHPSTQHYAAIGRFFITRFHQSSRALRSM